MAFLSTLQRPLCHPSPDPRRHRYSSSIHQSPLSSRSQIPFDSSTASQLTAEGPPRWRYRPDLNPLLRHLSWPAGSEPYPELDLVPLCQSRPHQFHDHDDKMAVPMTKHSQGMRSERYPNSFYDMWCIVVVQLRICR
jgi:hypothetical protein